ncbi:MAG: sporulation histidine kinase inhibitor Sda [Firmicutes bacterium]|nr:sporulation histidine kinase inhibitor Sda [Bacillota bacterium]
MNYLNLSNDDLLEAYYQARKLNLDKKFIQLLEEEIDRRQIVKEFEKPMSFNKE